MVRPLEGVRVIDMSRYIAGPLCAQILGDLGAEVIKVESPRGEESRTAYPVVDGFSLYFANYNRNKIGVTLNTRTDKGKGLLREIIGCSDVLIQNYRIGIIEKMGFSYPELSTINPRVIMVNISGFGRRSHLADWPAYDEVAQAMSGLMDITGPAGGPPTLVGTFAVDHMTALFATIGVLGALEYRQRTGEGQSVDVALRDVAMSTLTTTISRFLVTGGADTRVGNRHRYHAAINTYPTKDGYVYVNAARDHLWDRLLSVIGREDLRAVETFSTRQARAEHRDEIDAIIGAWASQRTSWEAASSLAQAGVPSAPVRTIPEIATDLEIREQRMVLDVLSPEGHTLPVVGNPIDLGKTPIGVRLSPPRLGEHNEYVYCQLLGHTSSELGSWRENGIV